MTENIGGLQGSSDDWLWREGVREADVVNWVLRHPYCVQTK